MMEEIRLYRNNDKCTQCGGKCCKIYLRADRGGAMPMEPWFEEWCIDFHIDHDRYSVEPLFDPLDVHMAGNEHMLQELIEHGIDPDSCQYIRRDGCSIPWERRPLRCREYKCEKFDESDFVGVALGTTTMLPLDRFISMRVVLSEQEGIDMDEVAFATNIYSMVEYLVSCGVLKETKNERYIVTDEFREAVRSLAERDINERIENNITEIDVDHIMRDSIHDCLMSEIGENDTVIHTFIYENIDTVVDLLIHISPWDVCLRPGIQKDSTLVK